MPRPTQVTERSLEKLAEKVVEHAKNSRYEKMADALKEMTKMQLAKEHSINDIGIQGKDNLVGIPALSRAMTQVLGVIKGKVEVTVEDQESHLEQKTEDRQELQEARQNISRFESDQFTQVSDLYNQLINPSPDAPSPEAEKIIDLDNDGVDDRKELNEDKGMKM